MPSFKYIAKNAEGKNMTGAVEAKDRNDAIDILRKKELIIVSVADASAKGRWSLPFLGQKRVKLDDLVVFSRQLATMVDAGIPLVGALDILLEQVDNKTLGSVITSVRNEVSSGSSLSDAMSRHKRVFSPLFVNMVKAGESSGTLDEILDRVAEYMEKTSILQKKVRAALVYPAIVSTMAFIITFVLVWKVVPVFKTVYEGFGAKLPVPTQLLIDMSETIQRYFFAVLIAVILTVFFSIRYISTEKGRLAFDSLLLKLPIFGVLLTKVAISKFARTLSTLTKSGVPILASLEIVAKTAGNKRVEKVVDEARSSVREGESISDPLSRSRVFPPLVTRMVSVGEKSGELEKMLTKVADFYDAQVDATVAALTSMIEPLIIVFLGLVVGSIVICMFLPIFRITSVINM